MKSFLDEKLLTKLPEKDGKVWHFVTDRNATGYEDLQLLHAIILANKPHSVIETGTYHGLGTATIVDALKQNGGGQVRTYDNLRGNVKVATRYVVEELKSLGPVSLDFYEADSGDPKTYEDVPDKSVDMAFVDCGDRHKAVRALAPKMKPGALLVIHDAGNRREEYGHFLEVLTHADAVLESYTIISTERGFAIGVFHS